jgi:hypothetical protein
LSDLSDVSPASSTATVSTSGTEDRGKKRKHNISENERHAVLHFLLKLEKDDGKLKRGALKTAQEKFGLSRDTPARIWKRYKASVTEECPGGSVCSRFSGNSGRKIKYDVKETLDLVRKVPLKDRGTFRDLARETGIPRTTLQRLFNNQKLKLYTGHIKPLLEDRHKIHRVKFALSHIKEDGVFDDLMQTIYLDEKWFYISAKQQRYYLTPEEWEDESKHPVSKCIHKSHITKVMFLCAVARPRRNWDGKIGCWPIVEKRPAIKNSKNRPAGTMVTHPLNVGGKVYTDLLLTKVLPAIKEKWPRMYREKPIVIQDDNAPAHPVSAGTALTAAAQEDGWNLIIKRQPARSPDMNILDLVSETPFDYLNVSWFIISWF